MTTINITPSPSIIRSWAKQIQWPTIFGEFIDNAFDAGATQLKITVSKDSIAFQDNGIGCGDLGRMLTAGHHGHHATTRLGRYGIGFKQAAASAGDVLEVQTVHKGWLRRGALDWKQLERSGSWDVEIDAPVREATHPSSMFISISKLRNKTGISEKSLTNLTKRLGAQYAPGLRQGRQILFTRSGKTIPIQMPSLPDLNPSMKETFLVNGKRAELLIGLIPEGHSYSKSGLTVSYGFRVIEEGKRWGLGNDPTPGLVGFLDLLDGWDLSTNKEKVLDDDLEELGKQIAEQCAAIIALAAKRGFSLPIQQMNTKLNEMLGRFLQQEENVREKRKPPVPSDETVITPGSLLNKIRIRRKRRPKHVQPGGTSLQEKLLQTGVQISFGNLGEKGPLWNYQEGELGDIIEFNLDNAYIAARSRQDITQLIPDAVYVVAQKLVLRNEIPQLDLWGSQPAEDTMGKIAQVANMILRDVPIVLETDEQEQ